MTTASIAELDQLLTALIQSVEGISDLLFVTGKPPLAEIHGRLQPPPNSAEPILTSARIEGLARAIMSGNERLAGDLAKTGSCDCSYSLTGVCR